MKFEKVSGTVLRVVKEELKEDRKEYTLEKLKAQRANLEQQKANVITENTNKLIELDKRIEEIDKIIAEAKKMGIIEVTKSGEVK